ncbi:Ctr copper transporter family protein [Metarhizium album ARSEF 1941]|uniref:Copper transport protein n=1 Tax=Metarhizium album (strain ARSEF 1941) TaxID=1081103 RepID=A0A0B2WF60_METAS|nr:Ctr copper transporter family protein [Metarhizium album ARSEF 1941]KHN94541.1 Ctr copper transporter family protein [Metarhizium album ARSEF 1941]
MDMTHATTTTMDMGGGNPTAMSMPSSTGGGGGGHSMGGMGGMGGMGNGCKISMLFNLNTVGSCFLSSEWRITSTGMFAGSCIGVFLLGMTLELLRRSMKEYDRFLVRQHAAKFASSPASSSSPAAAADSLSSKEAAAAVTATTAAPPPFRPNLLQQSIRAFLHLLAFVVAYILMLLAMYYNGYMILCIFLGSFFGAFIFQWETLSNVQQTSAAQEGTVCCG